MFSRCKIKNCQSKLYTFATYGAICSSDRIPFFHQLTLFLYGTKRKWLSQSEGQYSRIFKLLSINLTQVCWTRASWSDALISDLQWYVLILVYAVYLSFVCFCTCYPDVIVSWLRFFVGDARSATLAQAALQDRQLRELLAPMRIGPHIWLRLAWKQICTARQ